ncbi:MAG TPA: GGDEF domain-containing protein, partial [Solimonas sp.]
DPLTDLPNRMLFADRLTTGLIRARRESTQLALVYIDIDRFKPVNDRYGHGAGDVLLKAIAARLRGMLRASDTVARLGGDEFAAILDHIEGRSDAQALIELMQQALTRPFALKLGESGDAIEVEVGASFGLAMFPRDGDNEHQLISCADARMYAAKNARQA